MTANKQTIEEFLTAAGTILVLGGLLYAVSRGNDRTYSCLEQIGKNYTAAAGGEYIGMTRYQDPPSYIYKKDGRQYTVTFTPDEVRLCQE